MPPRLPRCSAFSLHKSYSLSGSESETPMSIRIPSALIFMWRLFCWHCKWKKTFLVVLRISSTTLLSLRSRRLEVVGAKKETREGSSSPLACLPLVYLSFLASTTSNHLLRRLYGITNYISRTQCSPYQAVINLPPEVTSYCLQVYQNLRSVKEYASEL